MYVFIDINAAHARSICLQLCLWSCLYRSDTHQQDCSMMMEWFQYLLLCYSSSIHNCSPLSEAFFPYLHAAHRTRLHSLQMFICSLKISKLICFCSRYILLHNSLFLEIIKIIHHKSKQFSLMSSQFHWQNDTWWVTGMDCWHAPEYLRGFCW